MTLFMWRSVYMKNYARGYLIAQAESVDAARVMLRSAFTANLKERYEWYFDYDDNLSEVEYAAEKRAEFEADIKAEPVILPGFVFIEGGE